MKCFPKNNKGNINQCDNKSINWNQTNNSGFYRSFTNEMQSPTEGTKEQQTIIVSTVPLQCKTEDQEPLHNKARLREQPDAWEDRQEEKQEGVETITIFISKQQYPPRILLFFYHHLNTAGMKSFTKFLKDTIRGGLLFLIPVIAIMALAGKVWQKMTGIGDKVSALFGLKPIFGINAAPIITSIVILLICFISGLLFRVTFMKQIRNRLDRFLMDIIPGYEFYKINIEEKISDKKVVHARPTVLLTMDGVGQAGVLIEELADGRKVIFIPAKPGTPEGHVYVVSANQVHKINSEEADLNKILKQQGKGLGALIGQ